MLLSLSRTTDCPAGFVAKRPSYVCAQTRSASPRYSSTCLLPEVCDQPTERQKLGRYKGDKVRCGECTAGKSHNARPASCQDTGRARSSYGRLYQRVILTREKLRQGGTSAFLVYKKTSKSTASRRCSIILVLTKPHFYPSGLHSNTYIIPQVLGPCLIETSRV